MEKMTLYTTHCPKCTILEKKLKAKNLQFEICEDPTAMQEKGIESVPVLEMSDGTMLDYFSAVKYVNAMRE